MRLDADSRRASRIRRRDDQQDRCDVLHIGGAPVDLQPQLWVTNTAAATAYYERAFGAVVEHRVGPPDDRVR
jgi:hypothetical protein